MLWYVSEFPSFYGMIFDSIVCIYILFIHASGNEHLGCFYPLVIVNNTAKGIVVPWYYFYNLCFFFGGKGIDDFNYIFFSKGFVIQILAV